MSIVEIDVKDVRDDDGNIVRHRDWYIVIDGKLFSYRPLEKPNIEGGSHRFWLVDKRFR